MNISQRAALRHYTEWELKVRPGSKHFDVGDIVRCVYPIGYFREGTEAATVYEALLVENPILEITYEEWAKDRQIVRFASHPCPFPSAPRSMWRSDFFELATGFSMT